MKIFCTFYWHLGPQILSLVNTTNQPNGKKRISEKASFSLMPFQNGFYRFQNSYIVLFNQMHYLNIAKHRCIHERKLKLIAFFNTFLFIPLRWKLQLKQRFNYLKGLKRTYIISNLFLDSFNRFTWHHCGYSHIQIPCNHEIINVIKIQNNPL